LKSLDNLHAKHVVDLTAQLWLHIPISFETAKADQLRLQIIELQPCAIAVTRNLTKEQNFLKQKGLRCGNPPIEKPLVGSLNLSY
jgi:hypothetical protein